MNLQEMLQKRAALIDKQKSVIASAKGGVGEDEKKNLTLCRLKLNSLTLPLKCRKPLQTMKKIPLHPAVCSPAAAPASWWTL